MTPPLSYFVQHEGELRMSKEAPPEYEYYDGSNPDVKLSIEEDYQARFAAWLSSTVVVDKKDRQTILDRINFTIQGGDIIGWQPTPDHVYSLEIEMVVGLQSFGSGKEKRQVARIKDDKGHDSPIIKKLLSEITPEQQAKVEKEMGVVEKPATDQEELWKDLWETGKR